MFRVIEVILFNTLLAFTAGQLTVNIISRQEWGARLPKEPPMNLTINPPAFIVIHHSGRGVGCTTQALCQAQVRSFQDFHIDFRKWDDIGYNFLIGEDGNVYEGRGWGIKGAHFPAYNARSLGICFIGNFDKKIPAPAAINTAKNFLDYAVTLGKLQSNYTLIGHRQGRSTTCPGDKLFELIQSWPQWKNVTTD
ncbi:peptidoglycan-recognition protein SC2-like [Microplitis demolitor]|uniref:peptidoglycan-recognition protein SC2-like n=1 Tax=Microplitis demolitor TaxID=69319 RepID=UPI0004CC9F03|nr:peptidoglycan-recognition protein SC2-like [Microplitis demolitor]